ncbi:hypothetical protein PR048_008828 [Dryococelus australis]|uniref:C2H2-type domain-containing protein n=1 Tax=Dryococelus australis TaxID=614101 RepID=A0ABQ9HZ37_9NEOP|nr:hypothetical protein PR048_008828 [Dryococelus australis]
MPGLRRLYVATMSGLRRLDMPGQRRLDVAAMSGLRQLDVTSMPGLRWLDVASMPGLQRLGCLLTSTSTERRPTSSLPGCRQCRYCDRVFAYGQNAFRHERTTCTKSPFRTMKHCDIGLMQFVQGDTMKEHTETCNGSSTGGQQVLLSLPPSTSMGTVSTDDYDETVDAKDGMTLNIDEHPTPATKKSKLDIGDEAGSENDHEDSIDDDYDDSDSVEDDGDSLDVPTHFTNEFPSTSGVKKVKDVENTGYMLTENPNKLVDRLKMTVEEWHSESYTTNSQCRMEQITLKFSGYCLQWFLITDFFICDGYVTSSIYFHQCSTIDFFRHGADSAVDFFGGLPTAAPLASLTGPSAPVPAASAEPFRHYKCRFCETSYTHSSNARRHEHCYCTKDLCCMSYLCDRCGHGVKVMVIAFQYGGWTMPTKMVAAYEYGGLQRMVGGGGWLRDYSLGGVRVMLSEDIAVGDSTPVYYHVGRAPRAGLGEGDRAAANESATFPLIAVGSNCDWTFGLYSQPSVAPVSHPPVSHSSVLVFVCQLKAIQNNPSFSNPSLRKIEQIRMEDGEKILIVARTHNLAPLTIGAVCDDHFPPFMSTDVVSMPRRIPRQPYERVSAFKQRMNRSLSGLWTNVPQKLTWNQQSHRRTERNDRHLARMAITVAVQTRQTTSLRSSGIWYNNMFPHVRCVAVCSIRLQWCIWNIRPRGTNGKPSYSSTNPTAACRSTMVESMPGYRGAHLADCCIKRRHIGPALRSASLVHRPAGVLEPVVVPNLQGQPVALYTPPNGFWMISMSHGGHGGRAVSLLASHQVDMDSIHGRVTPDFRMWESRWTMPLSRPNLFTHSPCHDAFLACAFTGSFTRRKLVVYGRTTTSLFQDTLAAREANPVCPSPLSRLQLRKDERCFTCAQIRYSTPFGNLFL